MDKVKQQLYQENILEHNKHPQNIGPLSDPTFSYKHRNPSCGDAFTMHVRIKKERVEDVKFEGVGCAISTASMSMLSEQLKGMHVKDVAKLTKQDIDALLGIEVTPAREYCAQLSRLTIQQGLKNHYE